jgi:phospholipid/cholesterol/gamma-HCH transport system substrate-binding protein
MSDQFKNIIIGLFVAAALIIIIFIILFLHPSTGDEGQVLYVRFSDVDKLNVGTRVTLAGKPVGEVVAIKQVETGRQGPGDEYGHVYVYELKLLIDSHVKVYETDSISARTSGLLGEKSVVIMPEVLKPAQKLVQVGKGEILYAQETGSVEETMKEFKSVAEKVDIALDSLTIIFNDITKDEIVQKVSTLFDNLVDISHSLDKPEELAAIINNLQNFTNQISTRIKPSWDSVDRTLGTLNDSAGNLRKMTNTANNVVTDISQGKGTAGKILVSDDLYLQLTSLLNKGEVVFDDIGHYGLLYHLDKGWQRLRARRVNLMQKLSSPQEFRNYFNDEIDQITTSLSRVSMVLDKTGYCYPNYPLLEDKEFSKVFAELLRRISSMEESLKIYNQQVVDSEVRKTEFAPACCH